MKYNRIVSNVFQGIQMGSGICLAIATVWYGASLAASSWGALPGASSGSTLSSSAWNDMVSQSNALANALFVSSGKVGIGKASPTNTLDVGNGASTNIDAQIGMNSATDHAGAIINAGGGKIAFIDFAEDDGTSLEPGRPTSNLKANVYWDGVNEFLGINNFGASKNTVINAISGNVGIGKSSPDAKLDVNGEVIRSVFYLEPGAVVNVSMPGWAWTNLWGGWDFTYTKKSATSKLLITVNATSRWNLNASSGWWQLGMYVGGTLHDFWGNYIAATDMHTPGMYRKAISGVPKGAVSIQGAILQSNASMVCIGCAGTPNITIEEIY